MQPCLQGSKFNKKTDILLNFEDFRYNENVTIKNPSSEKQTISLNLNNIF